MARILLSLSCSFSGQLHVRAWLTRSPSSVALFGTRVAESQSCKLATAVGCTKVKMGYSPSAVPNAPAPVAYGLEAVTALVSTLTVAPVIAIVDKAIFSNASGKEPLATSIRNSVRAVVAHPITFLRGPSFWWIWAVYGGTYTIANCVSLACERSGIDVDIPKFISTSAANVSLSVIKDRAFSRMYGVVAPKPVPIPSLGLFATRDSLSILASFNLPSMIAHDLHEKQGWSKHRADVFAQLTVPLAAQVFSTPLHLLGMDLYNRPGLSTAERTRFIVREYAKTTAARMARILPAFGAGGVLNKRLRARAHAGLAEKYGSVPVSK